MVTVRFKELGTGKFSAYLDIYAAVGEGKTKRNYEFLKIYVTKDYSAPGVRVSDDDKEKMKAINEIRNQRETEVDFEGHGLKQYSKMNYNLLDYFEERLKIRYNSKLECLNIHLNRYLGKKKVVFNDVDEDFLERLQCYFLTKVSSNTTHAYMSVFRQQFNKLVVKGMIQVSPFNTFKIVPEGDTEKTTLDIEEVRILAGYTPKRGNHQVRQAFLFACFTGLRFSDIKKLSYDEIIDRQLIFRPAKTSRKIVKVPLAPDALAILAGVPRHPVNKKVFWSLPASQVVNTYLKFWGLEAGLKKNLHFHAARHTFATIGLTFGIDIYTMKELLGHSKLEMTQIYAKLVDQKRMLEMMKFPSLTVEDKIIA